MTGVQADLIILADAMFTGTSPREGPGPGGLAVTGRSISAVGSRADMEALIGPGTRVFDFGKDSLLMPGFCDSHLHLSWTITAESGPPLRQVKSEDECVAITKKWLTQHPDVSWVVGNGWHQSNWAVKDPPDKRKLSAVIPDTPVCLMDVDCHAVWLNQKALDLAGITRDTPNAEGGVIYHTPEGDPSGYVEENPCMDIYIRGIESNEVDPAARRSNLRDTCAAFNRRGITSVMDALNTPALWLDTIDELIREDRFSLRLNCTVFLNDTDEYLEHARVLLDRYRDRENSLAGFWGFKALLDGVGGAHTAWMTADYADAPGNRGYPVGNPEVILRRVLDVERQGYGVHLHACGTRAVEFGLDMIEEAHKKGYLRGQRNTITHCDTVNEKDFSRFGALGVIASLQPDMLAPTHSWADNIYPLRFGEKLMKNAWANRRLFDSAAAVSLSSDSPVTIANPMFDIFRATQRVHDDGTPRGGIFPEQKLTLGECLWAFTYGGAYQLGREHELGTLEPGKLADITVLNKNIFDAAPEEYLSIESRLTLLNGRIVYEA
jgi:predicted amidohydrolase YtcJ